MPAYNDRVNKEELLDDPRVTKQELERSLFDLEWTNRRLGGLDAVLPHVLSVLNECDSILDVGCGSADMMRLILDAARKNGRQIRLVGVDLNPVVLDIATERCRGYSGIQFVRANATELPFSDESFDLVISSTFMHHLNPEEVVQSIREAYRVAKKRVVIADLVRSRLAWFGVWLIGRFKFGRLSRCDGPTSIMRAYRPDEFSALANCAGLNNRRLYRNRFYRMTLVSEKGKQSAL